MRLKSFAAAVLFGGLLSTLAAAPPALAAGFTDPSTVEQVAAASIAPPAGTKASC